MKYNNSLSQTTPTVTDTWVNYGSASSSELSSLCDTELTEGQLLYSNSLMSLQKSCLTHSYNAGNYYNFPAASASSSEPTTNSICPKGWSLPQNGRNTGYSHLLENYGVDYNASSRTNQDSALLNLPLSFLRSGDYSSGGSLGGQGNLGRYRMSSLRLHFGSGGLAPAYNTDAGGGYMVRCVSR